MMGGGAQCHNRFTSQPRIDVYLSRVSCLYVNGEEVSGSFALQEWMTVRHDLVCDINYER